MKFTPLRVELARIAALQYADAPFDLAEVKLAPTVDPARHGRQGRRDRASYAHRSRPLVTVVAPAGYGKTTFLARWSEADPRPFAWVALDGRDDDPVVLLRYVAGAMNRLEPLPPEVFDALSGRRIRLG